MHHSHASVFPQQYSPASHLSAVLLVFELHVLPTFALTSARNAAKNAAARRIRLSGSAEEL
jgi:hypothetical protein